MNSDVAQARPGLADRPGPPAEPRRRGVGSRGDDALPRRDRGGQRDPRRGDFYRESHSKIYRAALALYARGEPVDAITLVDELEQRGELEDVGGRSRVHELAALVPASANAGHYARIVREMATLRGLIRVGGEISRLGWDTAR